MPNIIYSKLNNKFISHILNYLKNWNSNWITTNSSLRRNCLRVDLSFADVIRKGYISSGMLVSEVKYSPNCPKNLSFGLLNKLYNWNIITKIVDNGYHVLFFLNVHYILIIYVLMLFFLTRSFYKYFNERGWEPHYMPGELFSTWMCLEVSLSLFLIVFLNFLAFTWLLANILLLIMIFNIDVIIYFIITFPFIIFIFWATLCNWLCVGVGTRFGLRWAYFSCSIVASPMDYLVYAYFGTRFSGEGKLRNWLDSLLDTWLCWVPFDPLLKPMYILSGWQNLPFEDYSWKVSIKKTIILILSLFLIVFLFYNCLDWLCVHNNRTLIKILDKKSQLSLQLPDGLRWHPLVFGNAGCLARTAAMLTHCEP